LDNQLSIFDMIPVIVCHAQFLKFGVSLISVRDGRRQARRLQLVKYDT
jgi:hypothetical protein